MAPRTTQINKSAEVKLSAAGTGRVKVGPTVYGDRWHGCSAAVSVATQIDEAVCYLYIGSVGPGNLIDTTMSGSTGDRADIPFDLTPGSELIAVWTGGDALALATLSVFGMHTTGEA